MIDTPARYMRAEDVHRLLTIITSDMPHMSDSVEAELEALLADPTRDNATRLAVALRYAGREGLAREIEDRL